MNVVKIYSKYYDAIQSLGKEPVRKKILIDRPGKSSPIQRSFIQAAYRDMRALGLKCDPIQFIGLVAAWFLLDQVLRRGSDGATIRSIMKEHPVETRAAMRAKMLSSTLDKPGIYKIPPDQTAVKNLGMYLGIYESAVGLAESGSSEPPGEDVLLMGVRITQDLTELLVKSGHPDVKGANSD